MVCSAQSVGLVRYPATLASTSRPLTVTTQCADNAHVRTGSSLRVSCTSTGSWTGTTPQCECDTGYHAVTVSGRQICQTEGKYYSALATPVTKTPTFSSCSPFRNHMSPNNRSDKQLCAILMCYYYKKNTMSELNFAFVYIVCPAQSVGLVRYPTTLAPASGPVTATTQCADNAHVRTGFSLSVRCSSI